LVGIGRQASTREYDCSILSGPVPSREQGFFSSNTIEAACIYPHRTHVSWSHLAKHVCACE
jgi:hypothetical protein